MSTITGIPPAGNATYAADVTDAYHTKVAATKGPAATRAGVQEPSGAAHAAVSAARQTLNDSLAGITAQVKT